MDKDLNTHFFRENYTNTWKNKRSMSLVIKEMQDKPQYDTMSHPLGELILKRWH